MSISNTKVPQNYLLSLIRAEQRGPSGPAELLARLRGTLFEQQRAFLDDHAHPKRAACCSRRAGKTQGVIRGLLAKGIEKPRSVTVYFATTLSSARKLVWDCPDGIPSLIQELGIDAICEVNESEHRVKFKNGSVLWVSGCETLQDARRWKGLRYDLAVPDEAQDWPEEILAYLVNEVLAPALMDRAGEILMTGTPSSRLDGLFYEICEGKRQGWGRHGWTCFENPHIPSSRSYVEQEIASRGLLLSDPIVQREFFGRWVRDETTLLYNYLPGRNDFDALPAAKEWQHVLGMDFGSRDLTTFVVNSFRQYDKTVYTSEAHGEKMAGKAGVTRTAEIIRGYQVKFGAGLQLVADCGALGLFIGDELRNRYSLPIIAAKKQEKAAAIRLLNDQLRLGLKRYGPNTGALKDQLVRLQIDPRTQIEKSAQACDFADADLYGWRHCYGYLAKPEPDNTEDGRRREMIDRVMARQRETFVDRSAAEERRDVMNMERG